MPRQAAISALSALSALSAFHAPAAVASPLPGVLPRGRSNHALAVLAVETPTTCMTAFPTIHTTCSPSWVPA
ncbi:hypothetical protein HQ447_01115 [bacterium]|nr:hypothetical protein [bacterium]